MYTAIHWTSWGELSRSFSRTEAKSEGVMPDSQWRKRTDYPPRKPYSFVGRRNQAQLRGMEAGAKPSQATHNRSRARRTATMIAAAITRVDFIRACSCICSDHASRSRAIARFISPIRSPLIAQVWGRVCTRACSEPVTPAHREVLTLWRILRRARISGMKGVRIFGTDKRSLEHFRGHQRHPKGHGLIWS